MLYLVGLGLSDETDITVKGLEVVKKASRVYLEAYTSILLVDQAVLVGIANSSEFFKELTLTSSRRATMEGQL
jgi:diphthamide biosynthesis methyltransferase